MPARKKLTSQNFINARARVARATQHATRYPDDAKAQAALKEAKRAYTELVATEFLQSIVDSAPPLSSEARSRLAAILVPVKPARRKVQP